MAAEPRYNTSQLAPAPEGTPFERVGGLILFVASFALATEIVIHKHAVDAIVASTGAGAYPLAIVIMAAVASAPFSIIDALAVSNGVMFGPWIGSVINAVALVIASAVSYMIARRTVHLLYIDQQIQRLPKWIRRFRVGSAPFLMLLRLVPGVAVR